MSSQVKMGLIIGAAIIIATGMWIYFSPFQTCQRLGYYTADYCASVAVGGQIH